MTPTPPDDWADQTAADIMVMAYADPDARLVIAQMLRIVLIRGAILQQEAPKRKEWTT